MNMNFNHWWRYLIEEIGFDQGAVFTVSHDGKTHCVSLRLLAQKITQFPREQQLTFKALLDEELNKWGLVQRWFYQLAMDHVLSTHSAE